MRLGLTTFVEYARDAHGSLSCCGVEEGKEKICGVRQGGAKICRDGKNSTGPCVSYALSVPRG